MKVGPSSESSSRNRLAVERAFWSGVVRSSSSRKPRRSRSRARSMSSPWRATTPEICLSRGRSLKPIMPVRVDMHPTRVIFHPDAAYGPETQVKVGSGDGLQRLVQAAVQIFQTAEAELVVRSEARIDRADRLSRETGRPVAVRQANPGGDCLAIGPVIKGQIASGERSIRIGRSANHGIRPVAGAAGMALAVASPLHSGNRLPRHTGSKCWGRSRRAHGRRRPRRWDRYRLRKSAGRAPRRRRPFQSGSWHWRNNCHSRASDRSLHLPGNRSGTRRSNTT